MNLIRSGVLVAGLMTAQATYAVVDTDFDEGALDPNISLDIPNGALASITLDTTNDELDFVTNGNTDMWTTRNNAPLAWTSAPEVGPGESWVVETEVRYDTDVNASKRRVAGIVFYGGPDGTGGSSQGMDFNFAINNWDDRGNPGYQAGVEVQGLGDNVAGDAGGNIIDPWTNDSAHLRIIITEHGVADHYAFYYKLNAGDNWVYLGELNSSVDNSRVALMLKNSGTTSAPDRSAAFTYFKVQPLSHAVPVFGVPGLIGLSLLLGLLSVRRFLKAG